MVKRGVFDWWLIFHVWGVFCIWKMDAGDSDSKGKKAVKELTDAEKVPILHTASITTK